MSASPPALWILDDGRIMGGGQQTALRLAAAAPGSVIVCPGSSRLAAAARERGIRVVPAPFPDPGPAAVRAIARLRRALAGAPPDAIVVSNAARCGLYAAVARPRLPVVHLMIEQDSARNPLLRRFLRRRGRVVALGAGAAAAYEEALGIPVERARNFLSAAELSALAGARRPRGDGPPQVGALARMIPAKGLTDLLDELAAVPGAWAGVIVVAAPEDPPYEQRVRAYADGERVQVHTELADLRGLLGSIDVLVVPSTGHEGQPTVIVEALAAGLPVVVRQPIWSSDYDGLPVTPYSTPDELAAALSDLLPPPPRGRVAERFGTGQALEAIARAARPSRSRGVIPS